MNLKRPRFIFISALAMLLLVGCVQAGQPPVDIDATVEASLEQALTIVPTPTAVPKWTWAPTVTPNQAPPTPTLPTATPPPTPQHWKVTPIRTLESGLNTNIVLAQDGMNRLVNIVLPSDYDPTRSYPLVIGFHGAMNIEKVSIEPQEAFTNLGGMDVQDWVDEFQFIAASPAGFNNADGNPEFIMGWNSFPSHRISKADDVGCTIDIIALIEETASIDTSRIFATGHSSGAIFTYKLATSTDRFRAIAPTAGLLVHNRIALASDQHPISILEVHGSEDIPVPYSGGGGVPTEQCYSVAETMSAFSKLNGCEPDSKPVPSEEEFLQWEEFPNCTQGLRTAHIRVEGYGHHYKNHGATHR